MWRVNGKTIFPRWQKARQTAPKCPKAKPQNPQATASISIISDWRQNSYRNGKQHAHKQQRPCWDDPNFHFKAFRSHILETVGWFGTTAICFDLQHRIFRSCYFEERKKCPFSELVLAMPRGRRKLLQPENHSCRKAEEVTTPLKCPEVSAKPLLHNAAIESSKTSSNSTSGLENFSMMTNSSISALENSIGMQFLDYDKKQSFEFFKASAELGNPKGLFNLGLCYETGCGTTVDLRKAVYYYEKAALKGHKYALYNFAIYNIKGLAGIKPDFAKGIQLLKEAADKGVSQAQVCLGVYYLEEENWAEAFKMFQAAAFKDTNAKFYVGMCYEYGWGVVQNSALATEMYAEAAQQGHEEATLKLGKHYERGIDPDLDFSMILYKMLVDTGHKGAKTALESLQNKRRSRWKLGNSRVVEKDASVNSYKTSMHSSASLPDFNSLSIKDGISYQQRLLKPKALHLSQHLSCTASLSAIDIQSRNKQCSLDLAMKLPVYLNPIITNTAAVAIS